MPKKLAAVFVAAMKGLKRHPDHLGQAIAVDVCGGIIIAATVKGQPLAALASFPILLSQAYFLRFTERKHIREENAAAAESDAKRAERREKRAMKRAALPPQLPFKSSVDLEGKAPDLTSRTEPRNFSRLGGGRDSSP